MQSRRYQSSQRDDQARLTRQRILAAASEAFLGRGFAATTIAAVARDARVSVPTVEAGFGTKAALLKAAIDVAIAGDDEPVPMLARDWVAAAVDSGDASVLIAAAGDVLAASQQRSAGLVTAAFEGAAGQPDLRALADQLVSQRAVTARWIVDAVAAAGALRPGWTVETAAETLWVLMDPAIYVRLVRDRGWSVDDYRGWWVRAATLLVDDGPVGDRTPTERTTS